MFLDKICNIKSTSETYDVNWEPTESTTIIYSWINCDFYKDKRNKYQNNWFVVEGKTYAYTVVLWWDKVNVKSWQLIELIDPDLWTYWDFIIDDVLAFRNINNIIDNFELKVSEKKK